MNEEPCPDSSALKRKGGKRDEVTVAMDQLEQIRAKEEELREWEVRLQQRQLELEAKSVTSLWGHHGSSTNTAGQRCHVTSNRPSTPPPTVTSPTRPLTLKKYLRRGKFLRSMVFGGLDGLTTSTAIICSTSGISTRPDEAINKMALGASVLFAFGVANLVADGFSMGMGDLLSTLAEIDHKQVKDSRALKGRLSPSDSHLNRVDDDDGEEDSAGETKLTAVWNGAAMFLSFVLFGAVPLLAYAPIGERVWVGREEWRFRCACIFCLISLFALGAAKGFVVAGSGSWLTHARTGAMMALTGSIASFLSFAISVAAHSYSSSGSP